VSPIDEVPLLCGIAAVFGVGIGFYFIWLWYCEHR
jgi:hypothetical protein